MQESNEIFYSLTQAAEYAHVCRQAIFVAIRKGDLKATKSMVTNHHGKNAFQWVIKKCDLDDYRKSKYIRDKRMVDGKKLFDIFEDRWSVLHASKVLSVPCAHIYYLIRMGKLRAYKKGNSWVLKKEDLLDHFNKGNPENSKQLEFG